MPMVTVYVKFFAGLGNLFPDLQPGESLEVSLPAQSTVEQLAEKLKLPGYKLIFVNGTFRKKTFILDADDQVAFIPAIAGG